MEDRAKKIIDACLQAIFAAFSKELGLTGEQASKIGACFGSGREYGINKF